MKRSQRPTAGCALAFAGVVLAMPARAQQATQTVATRFEFRAPEGCSSSQDFAARVGRRSARIRLVTDPNVRRSLRVEIQPTSANGALRGTVTVAAGDGTTRTRQLKAASCAEAVEALSLIATVTLDPDAMLGDAPAVDAPAEPPPKPEPPSSPRPQVKATARHPVARPAPATRHRFSFGLEAALLWRMAPVVTPGATASLAFEIDSGRVLAPFWRVSVTHAQRRGITEAGGDASFAFTLPTLEACPVRLGPRAFGVRPCLYGSLGVQEVWGSATLHDETHSRVVGAAGPALWAGWRISKVLEIIADTRVGWPFRRDSFAFDHAVFFRTPTPGFSFGLGVAGGFP